MSETKGMNITMNKCGDRIFVSGPSITSKEVEYVTEAVKNAWYDNSNYYNKKFEDAFKKYIGGNYAISLPSCTSAIHLAILALGIGQGDEIIVPDITWIATSAPISYVGAIPKFADIDKETWCITAESIERCITPNTKAVIPVDLYGNVPEMDEIQKICKKYNIAIIEDAAEAVGSIYNGRKAGSLGDIGVFSFHGSKIMTTGEGGMLLTDNEKIYNRCLKLRDHGRAESDKMFWNDEVGYKYKMSSMQAALGIAQLERIEELVENKRNIFNWYKKELKNIKGIKLNIEPKNTRSNYWMVTIVYDNRTYDISKEKLINELNKYNIDSRPFFYPLSMEPAYKEIPGIDQYSKLNKIAYEISPYAINLPCGMMMTQEIVEYVCKKLVYILNNSSKKK
ncbi:DegT/DnrJ/EryC1/StrS family aminotransferase [Acetobacterium sp. K1/6]|uniref:DegT/DnrJ/EryC1/StrS family aminotransferase n=1 Tax=Acetobacterium sp. K1/6 TaxID=3055467 RepID=UPI002AC9FE5D|nr:DegT/DnrJ/EryC1/StrS family aminotransferase [Acetobacterium sp. K1/6]MDZ5724900.1 DegT/DnrJ/EryC1/StrS family aminotransferase [Acetobacterium sp. K1/6]